MNVKKIFALSRVRNWRALTANSLMFAFILLTGVGAYMILPAAGFIVAGTACGLFGYLLGSE